jgi:hemerythrin-like domain-containing protein
MFKPLQALYQEHESIAAVLHALQYLAQEVARGKDVDVRVFRQILYYLDVFPERFHHPKEDQLLFTRVRARSPEAAAVIDKLERQHALGAEGIRNLEQSLLRWESGGATERQAFVLVATEFVARYREHMRAEEDDLMPLARRTLAPQDWSEIEAGFAQHVDPLHGAGEDTDPDELFRRILYLAPPPIGLGKP